MRSTLFVWASDPMPGWPENVDWQPDWYLPPDVIDVPGNHFTRVEQHATTTALAVDEWLTAQLTQDDRTPAVP